MNSHTDSITSRKHIAQRSTLCARAEFSRLESLETVGTRTVLISANSAKMKIPLFTAVVVMVISYRSVLTEDPVIVSKKVFLCEPKELKTFEESELSAEKKRLYSFCA